MGVEQTGEFGWIRKKKGEREGEDTGYKREKRGGRKRGIFPAFRRSKLDGPSIKVDLRIASYTWVPKS